MTTAPSTDREDEQAWPDWASRRGLALETWFVQAAFLVPAVIAAVDSLAAHVGAGGTSTRVPAIVTNPVANLVLASLNYVEVGLVVPLGLLLLSRTGQNAASLGLTKPTWRGDVWPGAGIIAAGFGSALVVALFLAPLRAANKTLFVTPTFGHVPGYYIVYGVVVAAITAIAEETLVSGYLLTRLDQLGWNPRRALALSLTLRTAYHVYYGLGFLVTIPIGYFLTRSFQKHHRLMRPIIAHFLYDTIVFTIAVLVT